MSNFSILGDTSLGNSLEWEKRIYALYFYLFSSEESECGMMEIKKKRRMQGRMGWLMETCLFSTQFQQKFSSHKISTKATDLVFHFGLLDQSEYAFMRAQRNENL